MHINWGLAVTCFDLWGNVLSRSTVMMVWESFVIFTSVYSVDSLGI